MILLRVIKSRFLSSAFLRPLRCDGTRMLSFESFRSYQAVNEPVLQFAPGSEERRKLKESLQRLQSTVTAIPIVVGDKEIKSSEPRMQKSPFNHSQGIAQYHWATADVIKDAIRNSLDAHEKWEATPIHKRAEIFLKAADLIAGKYRYDILAATMLGQGKTVIQAEIDAACELIDFLRFNVQSAASLMSYQPISVDPNVTENRMYWRPCEGFWAAITPFNFTAIGGNLCASPAFVGNVVVWKPSDTAMLSNYLVYKVFREAGLPPGVINFVPADGPTFGDVISGSAHLAGINFTGSVATFKKLWKLTSDHLDAFRTYPRLIGECGGKNYHLVHPSADAQSVAMATALSGFEYSGQKCSACSRLYVPSSLWPQIKDQLINVRDQLKLGSPVDFDSFMSAVIDDKSFARIKGWLDHAKRSNSVEILAGGKCDDSTGYFIQPTVLQVTDPMDPIMQTELFGPVVSVYVYEDDQFEQTVDLVNKTSPFALTGSIFAKDQKVIDMVSHKLRQSAGNFYINDKSTGSVVGQQPFGGARMSGTNDKAGGPYYLLKFSSPQSIKETKVPLTSWTYPSMEK